MSLWLQNILVVGLVLLAAGYLTWGYIQRRRKTKCENCGVFKAIQQPPRPRPSAKQD